MLSACKTGYPLTDDDKQRWMLDCSSQYPPVLMPKWDFFFSRDKTRKLENIRNFAEGICFLLAGTSVYKNGKGRPPIETMIRIPKCLILSQGLTFMDVPSSVNQRFREREPGDLNPKS